MSQKDIEFLKEMHSRLNCISHNEATYVQNMIYDWICELEEKSPNDFMFKSLKDRFKDRFSLAKVVINIADERKKQDDKWGEQNHPCLDQVLLKRPGGGEPVRMCIEYGIPSEKSAKSSCELAESYNSLTFAHIAVEEMSEVISEFDTVKRREELVQLAAVCVAWIEKIDRELQSEK